MSFAAAVAARCRAGRGGAWRSIAASQPAARLATRGMAGHSKWANIKHKKAKNDAQKMATNTRMARTVATAVRVGGMDPDPASNYHLDAAIRRAHKADVPKSVIERAIKTAMGGDQAHGALEEVVYEGAVGPVLFIVEALTDNRKRTAPQVRHLFSKYEGRMDANLASFSFETRGYMEAELKEGSDSEDVATIALEAGATDFELPEEVEPPVGTASAADAHGEVPLAGEGAEAPEAPHVKVYCEPKELFVVAKAMTQAGIVVHNEQIIKFPTQTVQVEDEETTERLQKLIEALDENEDVAHVWHNIA